jgi:hypothetical protein
MPDGESRGGQDQRPERDEREKAGPGFNSTHLDPRGEGETSRIGGVDRPRNDGVERPSPNPYAGLKGTGPDDRPRLGAQATGADDLGPPVGRPFRTPGPRRGLHARGDATSGAFGRADRQAKGRGRAFLRAPWCVRRATSRRPWCPFPPTLGLRTRSSSEARTLTRGDAKPLAAIVPSPPWLEIVGPLSPRAGKRRPEPAETYSTSRARLGHRGGACGTNNRTGAA